MTVVLLLFVGVILVVQIAKGFRPVEQISLSEVLNVVSTLAMARCPACLTIEKLTQELLDPDFAEMVKAENHFS